MNPGPVMLDLDGDLALSSLDRERLVHPAVGGVILFARNYHDLAQLEELTRGIHRLREPRLLIAVDQEGGRVQRFKEPFTRLPCAAAYGELFDQDAQRAIDAARAGGYVMAAELLPAGIDFSFAPVLDVALVDSAVIGDRAFHQSPRVVSQLAGAWIDGMNRAGMAATGKHFPGHGGVAGDSHLCLPCDSRGLDELLRRDLKPYQALIPKLAGIMTAHVLFESIDSELPTYSKYWLETVLRDELYFDGVVFSDDLAMAGAKTTLGAAERARQALSAGCDTVLICNDADAAAAMLDADLPPRNEEAVRRFARMRGAGDAAPDALQYARQELSATELA